MAKAYDIAELIGQTYGRLKILRVSPTNKGELKRVICECLCGQGEKVISLSSLISGNTKTCGCGGTQAIEAHSKMSSKQNEQLCRMLYTDFLTEEEIVRICDGAEIWMDAPEIRERLEKRQSIREQEAIDEAKETYTPEFYAESVFNDIMEDCQGFEYDVEDIIQLLSDKLDKALVTKEETLCEGCLDCEDLTDDDEVFVQFFPNEENPVYSLYFNKAGEVWDGDTEPFKSFLVEVDSFTRQDLKMYANTLGVTYAHNTKKETLATNLDIKVKEIVDSLNEEQYYLNRPIVKDTLPPSRKIGRDFTQ